MSPAQSQSAKLRVLVVHGNETLYRRNDLERKVENSGALIVSTLETPTPGSVASALEKVDALVAISSTLSTVACAVCRDASGAAGKKYFPIPHQTSAGGWQNLRAAASSYAASKAVVALVGLAPLVENADGSVSEAHRREAVVAEGPAFSPTAKKLFDAELKLAAKEKRVAELEAELEAARRSGGAQVRDQLAADVARKESERVAAVRKLAEVEAGFVARLEAAERDRREEVEGLKASLEEAAEGGGAEEAEAESIRARIVLALAASPRGLNKGELLSTFTGIGPRESTKSKSMERERAQVALLIEGGLVKESPGYRNETLYRLAGPGAVEQPRFEPPRALASSAPASDLSEIKAKVKALRAAVDVKAIAPGDALALVEKLFEKRVRK